MRIASKIKIPIETTEHNKERSVVIMDLIRNEIEKTYSKEE